MCLAVPMRIIDIDGRAANVDSGGVRRKVRIDLLDGLSVGDYVLIHAGLAIARLDEKEAEETLSLLREVGARCFGI